MKSALIISVQGIGNTVLMTPVVASLANEGFEVDTIVSDNGSHEVMSMFPQVRKRFLWIERDRVFRNLVRLRAELRTRTYDVAYALYPNGKRENALLWLTRASKKTRYTQNYFRLLDFLPADRKLPLAARHDVISNLKLLEANGNSQADKLQLFPPDSARQHADWFFGSNDLLNKFTVAVHPGGGGAAKQWSEANYRELCSRLLQDDRVRLLVFGGSAEEPLVQRITQAFENRALPVCGLCIDKVAALVEKCRLLIGNDSALAHIAAALDLPAVAIWGYTDFFRVGPFNPKSLLIRIDYPCNPCYQFATGYIDDCRYHLKCIRDISVEQVHRIVQKYISLIENQEPLNPGAFADDPAVAKLERLEGGCLKIDLKAA